VRSTDAPVGSGVVTTTEAISLLRCRGHGEGHAGILTQICPAWPPGAGTSMLARCLTTLLPAMTLADPIEITHIHRVAGLTGDRTALVMTRPCRAPHHTISDARLIGGGHVPMPGDVSLAHHGVLFLDELPEFRRHVLEVLRQPLEKSVIYI
jgi:magnesium chelatase family protein